jgi:hypothetical protein
MSKIRTIYLNFDKEIKALNVTVARADYLNCLTNSPMAV